LIEDQYQKIEQKIQYEKSSKFGKCSLIDNWDSDVGISEKSYKILEEMTLDKVAGKIILKIHHPYGLRPTKKNLADHLEENHSNFLTQSKNSQNFYRKNSQIFSEISANQKNPEENSKKGQKTIQ